MDYTKINYKILEVFEQCRIHSFPVDCFSVLEYYNIKYKKYSEQSPEKLNHCLMVSDDAFTLKNIIFYNDHILKNRIRFSLAHELGHHVLGHYNSRSASVEQEANYFASNLLAPRIAIHYSKARTEADVSKLFSLTKEAAGYALLDYRRWYKFTCANGSRMPAYDKKLYEHFYQEASAQFVFSVKHCTYCDQELVNCLSDTCPACRNLHAKRIAESNASPAQAELRNAEAKFLYGFL